MTLRALATMSCSSWPAAGVLGLELFGQAARLVRHALVGGQQQARRDVGRAHAARGVDARREHEGDVVAVDLFAGQAGDVEQRAQADLVRPLRQHLQPELGDDAILADQRHDVGKCADGGDLDECRQPGGLARTRAQRLHELERDADAGEVLVGVAAVVPLGIDDRDRRPAARVGLVVVGDDQVDARARGRAGRRRRRECRNRPTR